MTISLMVLRPFLGALCLLGLLATACGGGEPAQTSKISFDATRAMNDIQVLSATIGQRTAGSAASAEAATYIANELGKAHFGVIRSEFEFETSPNRAATVSVGSLAVTAASASGSGFGAVTGPAVVLTSSGPQALAGKVAVAQRGGSTFQELSDRARASGAIALVIINSEPGPFTASLAEPATFPVVTLAGSDGDPVRAAAAAGQTVTVNVGQPETTRGTNLIARPISAHSCTYAVVANYDSSLGSPGANDNASGVAVLLELARGFGAMPSPPEVCLIVFDARANGAAGSTHYLDTVSDAGRPAVIIAVSRVGSGGELTISGETTVRTEALRIADVLGFDSKDGGSAPPVAGDSAVFSAAGISTVDITRSGGRPFRDDLAKEIDADLLKEAVQLAGELALGASAKAKP